MELSVLSPYIRRAMDHTVESLDWKLRERVIFDYELLYIKEGEASITILDTAYTGKPGDVFLIKPGFRHSIRSTGPVLLRQPHIHFDLYTLPDSPDVKIPFWPYEEMTFQEKQWFRHDVCSAPPFQLPNHFRLRSPAAFEQMLLDLITDFQQKLPYYETRAKGLFIELWVLLLREWHWTQNKQLQSNQEALLAVKQYISHHLDRSLAVEEMAGVANMSKNYFIRTFRSAFGTTPVKFHLIMRIEKAKELIQFTSVPISEIAENTGFSGIHSFSRSFRNIEGVPPSYYRQNQQKE
jgi:AraC-like DNA-binding protein